MTRWLVFLTAAMTLLPQWVLADERTREVQEALRTRELYYGDVTGVMSPATTEAIRRFQDKKGLEPTGLPDEGTLRALGVIAHVEAGAPGSERVEECRDFVDRYLHVCQSGNIGEEMTFYANRVDYMDEGPQSRGDIEEELQSYRRNWPERRLKLEHCVASPSPANPDEMIVTFRYDYDVHGDGHERKGVEDLNLTVRLIGKELKIVAIREL